MSSASQPSPPSSRALRESAKPKKRSLSPSAMLPREGTTSWGDAVGRQREVPVASSPDGSRMGLRDSASASDGLEPYRTQVQSMPVSQFCMLHSELFLVKDPISSLQDERPRSTSPDAQTTDIGWSGDPWEGAWKIFALPTQQDKISIGRALSSTIQLRLPFLSKTHCHLEIGVGGRLILRDDYSQNGTFHNRMRLAPGAATSVHAGDELGFGALHMSLLDARRLYYVVLNELQGKSLL